MGIVLPEGVPASVYSVPSFHHSSTVQSHTMSFYAHW